MDPTATSKPWQPIQASRPVLNQQLPPDLQGIVVSYLSYQELKLGIEQGLAGQEFAVDAEVVKKSLLTRIGDLLVKLPRKKSEVELWKSNGVPLFDQIELLEIYELDTLPSDKIHTEIAAGIREGSFLSVKEKAVAKHKGLSEVAALISKTILSSHRFLATIEILEFRNKNLTYIPNSISLLTNLEFLFLQGNRFSVAPDLSQNIKLKHLDLSRNPLLAPPDLSKNTQLEELYLNQNQLVVAPDLSKNIQLKSLFLNNNQLTIPPEVSKNIHLCRLILMRNQLTMAPDLSNNKQLKQLLIDDNRITVAPVLNENKRLEIVWIKNNNLSEKEKMKLKAQYPNIIDLLI